MACGAGGAVKGFMLLLLVMVLVWSAEAQSKRQPPTITEPNRSYEYFKRSGVNVTLICQATGQPTPTYEWHWNSAPIYPNTKEGISYDSTTGVLKIVRLDASKEGFFFCQASNTFTNGVTSIAVSAKTEVRVGRIAKFDRGTKKDYGEKEEGDYFSMQCDENSPIFYGPTQFKWYRTQEDTQTEMTLDSRRFIDSNGTLHFSYLEESDKVTDQFYACGLSNAIDGNILIGGKKKFTVKPADIDVNIQPILRYPPTPHNVKCVIGQECQLECFYSGKPTPEITWHRSEDEITTGGRYTLENFDRILKIASLKESDQGIYNCIGKNDEGTSSSSVYLDVTSPPIWIKPLGDITQVQGEDAVFHCDTRSAAEETEPAPPRWYKNAQPFDETTNPNKFKFSDEDRMLTVLSVQKDTDIICFQCYVDNHVGEAFSDGCLNVILPITIETSPAEKQTVVAGDIVNLTVTATSDALFPPSYKWIFKNVTYEDPVAPPDVTFYSSTKVAYINTTGFSDDEMKDIAGVYYRYVYHSHQTKIVEIEVIFESEETETVVVAAGFDYWIIGLIIGIFLIILVIIIICCVCRRKMLEGDYPVDRKETAAGLDPERELKDSGFHDLSRADYDYMPEKKPLGDLDFDENIPLGDDESFGDEYGDEAQAFTEDGSFIGVYSKTKKEGPPGYQSGESNV